MTIKSTVAQSLFHGLAALSTAGPISLCIAVFLGNPTQVQAGAAVFLSAFLCVGGLLFAALGLCSEWLLRLKAREMAARLNHRIDYHSVLRMAFRITSSLGKVIPAPYGAPVRRYQDAQIEIRHCPNTRQTQILTHPD